MPLRHRRVQRRDPDRRLEPSHSKNGCTRRDQASLELDHIDALITAADLRTAVANHELDIHDKQIAHAAEVDDYLKAKYTGPDLYGWMIARLSSVYFQAFQLATDLATRAERSFRFELGLPTSSFIQPGHWDSLKKGLLAGESLASTSPGCRAPTSIRTSANTS